MADGRDYRNHRGTNGARDYFFVESPEIFDRSAAASHNHHVDRRFVTPIAQCAGMVFVEKPDRAHYFMSSAVALDARRHKENMHRTGAA